MVKYNNENTKDEENIKVSEMDLYNALAPFFDLEPMPDNDKSQKNPNDIWAEPLKQMLEEERLAKEHSILVSADIQAKGTMLYNVLMKKLDCLVNGTDENGNRGKNPTYPIKNVLVSNITKDVCKTISYNFLVQELRDNFDEFDDSCEQFVKDLYLQKLELTDENTLYAFEPYKLSEIQRGCKDGMTIESSWDFKCRKHKEKLEQRKIWAKEKREQKKQERKKKFECEEGPMLTSGYMEKFKAELNKQFPEEKSVLNQEKITTDEFGMPF